MTSSTRFVRSVAVMLSVSPTALLLGCGGSGEQGSSDGPSALAQENVVAEVHYSETGSLRVIRQESGKLGLSLRGKIGEDDYTAVRERVGDSLVNTYLALRPGEKQAPSEIAALDVEFKLQVAKNVAERAARGPRSVPVQPKDQAGFLSAVCHPYYDTNYQYHPRECVFKYGAGMVYTAGSEYWPGDWSFAWNQGQWIGEHFLWNVAVNDVRRVSPWTWQLDAWYQDDTWDSSPTLLADHHNPWNTGDIGVTTHWRYTY